MSAVRRTVIFVAQILVLIFIVIATMAGALAGDGWLTNAAPMFGNIVALMPSAPISIAGAVAAFFVSIVLAALFFLLIEIANNTRNPFGP
jgi:ABC-type dipeptide/oligopeptide/nickel transport system permease subunit